MPFVGNFLELGRNILVLEFDALGLIVPDHGLHLHQVDHADEIFLGADRNLDRHRVGLQSRLHLLVHAEVVRTGTIHLVDERETRHSVFVGLTPHRFGLRLHAAYSAIHHASAVEHAHRTFNLNGEVDVTRGINNVDAMLGVIRGHATPVTGRRGRSNGNTALLFLLHPVHGGGAVMHFANLVIDAGVEQHTFRGRGFTRVNVRGNTDVPVAFYRSLA